MGFSLISDKKKKKKLYPKMSQIAKVILKKRIFSTFDLGLSIRKLKKSIAHAKALKVME